MYADIHGLTMFYEIRGAPDPDKVRRCCCTARSPPPEPHPGLCRICWHNRSGHPGQVLAVVLPVSLAAVYGLALAVL